MTSGKVARRLRKEAQKKQTAEKPENNPEGGYLVQLDKKIVRVNRKTARRMGIR